VTSAVWPGTRQLEEGLHCSDTLEGIVDTREVVGEEETMCLLVDGPGHCEDVE
jgi:hypothetical protein